MPFSCIVKSNQVSTKYFTRKLGLGTAIFRNAGRSFFSSTCNSMCSCSSSAAVAEVYGADRYKVSVEMDGDDNEKTGMRKGPWSVEEDQKLITCVSLCGQGRWDAIDKSSGLRRNGKSCRLSWVNYLRPDLKRTITVKEEQLILDLHKQWGNRWSRISESLPGRTDNEIKNYFRNHISKKLLPNCNKDNIKNSEVGSSDSSAQGLCSASSTDEKMNQQNNYCHRTDILLAKVPDEGNANLGKQEMLKFDANAILVGIKQENKSIFGGHFRAKVMRQSVMRFV